MDFNRNPYTGAPMGGPPQKQPYGPQFGPSRQRPQFGPPPQRPPYGPQFGPPQRPPFAPIAPPAIRPGKRRRGLGCFLAFLLLAALGCGGYYLWFFLL
ncbi:MAG: hypothetical protein LBQ40_04810 [Clostridiales bacterium]|nr:hypothetical protein [Clostridiales bacterium]